MVHNIFYYESGECRVIIYEGLPIYSTKETPHGTIGAVDHVESNCPGCGQFGRTKGK